MKESVSAAKSNDAETKPVGGAKDGGNDAPLTRSISSSTKEKTALDATVDKNTKPSTSIEKKTTETESVRKVGDSKTKDQAAEEDGGLIDHSLKFIFEQLGHETREPEAEQEREQPEPQREEVDNTVFTFSVTKPTKKTKTGVSITRASNGKTVVKKVEQRGYFSKTGLKAGDEVLKINDVKCKGMSTKAVAGLVASSVGLVTLVVRRNDDNTEQVSSDPRKSKWYKRKKPEKQPKEAPKEAPKKEEEREEAPKPVEKDKAEKSKSKSDTPGSPSTGETAGKMVQATGSTGKKAGESQNDSSPKPLTRLTVSVTKPTLDGRLGVAILKGENNNTIISKVDPVGLFSGTGLAVGDEVLEVNGNDCRRLPPPEVAKLVSSSRVINMVVARKGEVQEEKEIDSTPSSTEKKPREEKPEKPTEKAPSEAPQMKWHERLRCKKQKKALQAEEEGAVRFAATPTVIADKDQQEEKTKKNKTKNKAKNNKSVASSDTQAPVGILRKPSFHRARSEPIPSTEFPFPSGRKEVEDNDNSGIGCLGLFGCTDLLFPGEENGETSDASAPPVAEKPVSPNGAKAESPADASTTNSSKVRMGSRTESVISRRYNALDDLFLLGAVVDPKAYQESVDPLLPDV